MNDTPPIMDEATRQLAEKWGFTPEIELPKGYCSRVYADSARILKAPFQGEEMTSGLVAALKMSGNIGPEVFAWDEASGSLLMERVLPGTMLHRSGLSDEECLKVAVKFIKLLRSYPTEGLMRLADYVDGNDPLAQELLATPTEEAFLHGDLHHENVLLGPNGWVVIDAKGIIGDPAYEPAAFMHNPFNELPNLDNLHEVLKRRILLFSEELRLDSWRVWAWSVVLARDGDDESGSNWNIVRSALETLGKEFGRH